MFEHGGDYKRTIGVAIGGVGLFGAERRILKIYTKLIEREGEGRDRYVLILAPEFYQAAQKSEFANRVFNAAKARGSLIILPSKTRVHWRSVGSLMRFMLSRRSVAYMGLGTRRYARLFAALNIPIAYEITSPDIATTIVDESKAAFLKAVDLFVCVSPPVEQKFRTSFRARFEDRSPLDAVSYSVPYCEIKARSDKPREKLVVSASRFIQRKNVHKLAEAIMLAEQRMPDWSFALLGDGEMKAEIERTVAPLLSQGRIEVGYTSDVSQYLARSMIYVSLIEPDNYPSQSIVEAMANENALLLSDGGNSGKFIAPSAVGNGALSSLDVGEIADNLVRLAADYASLHAMGGNSRRHVEDVFSLDNYIREFNQVIDTIADRNGRSVHRAAAGAALQ